MDKGIPDYEVSCKSSYAVGSVKHRVVANVIRVVELSD